MGLLRSEIENLLEEIDELHHRALNLIPCESCKKSLKEILENLENQRNRTNSLLDRCHEIEGFEELFDYNEWKKFKEDQSEEK